MRHISQGRERDLSVPKADHSLVFAFMNPPVALQLQYDQSQHGDLVHEKDLGSPSETVPTRRIGPSFLDPTGNLPFIFIAYLKTKWESLIL